jgi:homoserine kinase
LKNNQLYIRVPGTSANLGPGFDILGMALELYNEFYFDFSAGANFSSSLIDGSSLPFTKNDDLVYSSYLKYFEIHLNGREVIPYNSVMNLGLPLKGGLGSSASAVVAGFSAAREVHKKFYPKTPLPKENSFLYTLAEIEGHPDNTIPAYMGGVVLAYFSGNKELHFFKKKFPNEISLLLFTPTIEVETNGSRKKLPEVYKVEDVIFNMSRVATWFEFLEHKKFRFLQLALEDKVHTPYRIFTIHKLTEVIQLIESLGGLYSLSGSGPSLLIYMKKKNMDVFFSKFKVGLNEIMLETEIPYTIQKVKPSQTGVSIRYI